MKLSHESFKDSENYWHQKAGIFAGLYKTKNIMQVPNRIFLKHRMKIVSRFMEPDPVGVALDVGCGSGEMAIELSKIYKEVIAFDYSEIMLDIAKERATSPNIAFFKADSASLPIPDQSADGLFALGLLDYVRDVNSTLTEFSRVLKPGAKCVVTAPKSPSLFAPLRWSSSVRARLFGIPPIVHAFTREEIERVFTESGFSSLEIIPLWTTMWICHVKKKE